MLILAIGVSTMIAVAIVVFVTQYYAYRKDVTKREAGSGAARPASDRGGSARGTQEMPITP